MSGRFHRSIERAHQRYGNSSEALPPTSHFFHTLEQDTVLKVEGSVFRVSPNELSFASVKSWRGVYGPWPGQIVFPKSTYYDIFGAGFDSGCIGSERDPVQHARMRRFLAPAFSLKALSEQEDIVQQCVDAFVSRLNTAERVTAGGQGLNMTVWYEMLAFDILGEMAFGETFHCIEDGRPHFWQQMIAKHLYFITVVDNLRRYPLMRWLGGKLLPWLTVEIQNKHSGFSRAKISR